MPAHRRTADHNRVVPIVEDAEAVHARSHEVAILARRHGERVRSRERDNHCIEPIEI